MDKHIINKFVLNDDNFTADFGDNKFPYYQGNTSVRLEEQSVDEDDEEEAF